MSLNIDTHKTGYVLIGQWKCCDQKLAGNKSCIFHKDNE